MTRACTRWHMQEEVVEGKQGSVVIGTLGVAAAPCVPGGWALGLCCTCLLSFHPHGKIMNSQNGLLLCPFYFRKLKFGLWKGLSKGQPSVNSTAWIGRSADGFSAAMSSLRILISTSHFGDTNFNGKDEVQGVNPQSPPSHNPG